MRSRIVRLAIAVLACLVVGLFSSEVQAEVDEGGRTALLGPGGDLEVYDVAPCGGDGIVELADMLAMLDAYGDIYACSCPADSAWILMGNGGTDESANFVGTTDNAAFNIRVNDQRVMHFEPNDAAPNIIGGFSGNQVTAGVFGATIAGGGGRSANGLGHDINRVTDDYGTIGGGAGNQAGDAGGTTFDAYYATVGGGLENTASGHLSTVGGGLANTASNFSSTVAGGDDNTASGGWSAVGGGELNTAGGIRSTVAGGFFSAAYGSYSTVGGGESNETEGFWSTVAGGQSNWAAALGTTVGGGQFNWAHGENSTVGGGLFNAANGDYSAIPGGEFNQADGDYSFAAGRRAKVRNEAQSDDEDGDEGTFVWADSTNFDFVSTGPNQFLIRASGGVGINTNAPAEALDVSGNIHASGTIASGSSVTIDGTAHAISSDAALELSAPGGVGIGTATPAAQLDVNGATRTTTLEITGGSQLVPSLVGWGNNGVSQTDVPFDTYTTASAGGYHSLAIRNDGTLAGWGYNGNGEIDIPEGTFTAVAAGSNHSLAIRTDGTLAQWGDTSWGQMDGFPTSGTFIAVAAGLFHSLAIRSDGTLVGWGYNASEQTNVPEGMFVAIAAGSNHSLAIRSDGTLAGWGHNFYGQITVPSGTFTAVAAGSDHGLAIRSDGTLVGWGYNDSGQTSVPEGTFVTVAASGQHSLAIRTEGTLAAWGNNDYGQINVPFGMFTAVAAGYFHNLAIGSGVPPPDPALRLYSDSALKPGSNTWTISSDRRLKTNIEPLSGALDRLLQLRGVTFQWLDPSSQGGIAGTQMGLIADEVRLVFPQWVGRDRRGYQTLTVGGFEALTAEALRDLRAEKDRQIKEKDCELDELRQEKDDLADRLAALEKKVAGLTERKNGD